MSRAIPESIWALRPQHIVDAFPDRPGVVMVGENTLRLPATSRGFDEFRDWAPGRSVELNYVMAFPEVTFDPHTPAWRVGTRMIRLTPDEELHHLMVAVALAEEPAFTYTITRDNIDTVVARSVSPRSEDLELRMLLSAFRTVSRMAMVNMFYGAVLDAIPGMVFHAVGDNHKKFEGLWHGHRFQVKVRGRQARLNIWGTDRGTEHPLWHAHISYPNATPLWEQIDGDAAQAVHTLFADLVADVKPTDNAPAGQDMPGFTVGRLLR